MDLSFGSSRNLGARLGGHHFEFSTIEENSQTVVGKGPKTSCGTFQVLDLAVESFGDGVGDGVSHVGQEVVEAAMEHFGDLDDRRQATATGPAVPFLKEGLGSAGIDRKSVV